MGLLTYLKSLFILQLLMGFVFVVSGLIINFIQLCTCVLWPFNKQLYRRINCRLAYSLWSRECSPPRSHVCRGKSWEACTQRGVLGKLFKGDAESRLSENVCPTAG